MEPLRRKYEYLHLRLRTQDWNTKLHQKAFKIEPFRKFVVKLFGQKLFIKFFVKVLSHGDFKVKNQKDGQILLCDNLPNLTI